VLLEITYAYLLTAYTEWSHRTPQVNHIYAKEQHFSASPPRGWSNTATGLLERWSMPQTCQCLRGIWAMPLIICF